jgi:UDP-N-acetyl-2-amino-2-deoxyglucuronate dehydrogenase
MIGEAATKWYRTQSYYDSGDWRGTWRWDGGGSLMSQGIHCVDLLQWMMGRAEQVVAVCGTVAHDIDVEDAAIATVSFEGGSLGLLQASTAIYPGLPERLEVSGDGGTVVIQDGQIVRQELSDERGEIGAYGANHEARFAAPTASGASGPAGIRHEGHRRQLADFVRAVRTGSAPAVTGQDGRKPLEIILAAYESARTGVPVCLPSALAGR